MPIEVRNVGDESAKDVVVHVELILADSTLDEADLTVDWLPGRSTRTVVALFARRPDVDGGTTVRITVRGYIEP